MAHHGKTSDVLVVEYNLLALIGWMAIFAGLIAAAVHEYAAPFAVLRWFVAVELLSGAGMVTLAGPLRTTRWETGDPPDG
jgi:hypothetical protein